MIDHPAYIWARALPGRASGNLRGALWLTLAALSFSAMNGLIKHLGQDGLHGFEIAFFRSAFGLAVLTPVFWREGLGILKTEHVWLHVSRNVFGVGTMLLLFWSLTVLPLAAVTAVVFSNVLFMIPLAVLFLGEVVRWRRWAATIAGFFGVLVILSPGVGSIDPAMLVPLAAAFTMAAAMLSVKKLTAFDKPITVMLWFSIAALIVTAGPAAWTWTTPSWEQLAWLAGIGALGSLGQYGAVRAYKAGDATAVTPFSYFQLVFATVIGLSFFAETPRPETLAGGAIIVAANLYILWREKAVSAS